MLFVFLQKNPKVYHHLNIKFMVQIISEKSKPLVAVNESTKMD